MPSIIEFLEEEKVNLTNSILEFVQMDWNPQKLIDKKNYVESLIKKATKKYKVEDDSVEVEWNKSNLPVSAEDSIDE